MHVFPGKTTGGGGPQLTQMKVLVEIDRLAEFSGDAFFDAMLRPPDCHIVKGVSNKSFAESEFVVEIGQGSFCWYNKEKNAND